MVTDRSQPAQPASRLTMPLLLVLEQGCTYQEAAERLGVAPEEVARRLREALRLLGRSHPPR